VPATAQLAHRNSGAGPRQDRERAGRRHRTIPNFSLSCLRASYRSSFDFRRRAGRRNELHVTWMPEPGSRLLNLVYRTGDRSPGVEQAHFRLWEAGSNGFAEDEEAFTKTPALVSEQSWRGSPARPASRAPDGTPRARPQQSIQQRRYPHRRPAMRQLRAR